MARQLPSIDLPPIEQRRVSVQITLDDAGLHSHASCKLRHNDFRIDDLKSQLSSDALRDIASVRSDFPGHRDHGHESN
jgi:hypothetical protein